MFDLKQPCDNCPFRRGAGMFFQLPQDRIEEIVDAPAFQCHKTVDYEYEEGDPRRSGSNPQQCKGLMSMLAHCEQPNQIMRVAEAVGECTVESHMLDCTYESVDEAIEDHANDRS